MVCDRYSYNNYVLNEGELSSKAKYCILSDSEEYREGKLKRIDNNNLKLLLLRSEIDLELITL